MRFYFSESEFIDTQEPIDLSIPIRDHSKGVRAWYLDFPKFDAIMENGFVGSVVKGGAVNFRNIQFNPHGHGTHTESFGHITPNEYPVSNCFAKYFFRATLISVLPEVLPNGDRVITRKLLEEKSIPHETEALVVRTLPNEKDKCEFNYSDTNPIYFDVDCMSVLSSREIAHLLVDIPSVDRESDNGVLAFHHAFWNVPANPAKHKTITELIFAHSDILDGEYILELQVSNFENDAAPSRPVLYKIKKEGRPSFLS